MTRETKIGLLVGLAFIIVIGILLSDHMTSTTEPAKAPLSVAGSNVRESVVTPAGSQSAPPVAAVGGNAAGHAAVTPNQTVMTGGDLSQPVRVAPPAVQVGPGVSHAQPPVVVAQSPLVQPQPAPQIPVQVSPGTGPVQLPSSPVVIAPPPQTSGHPLQQMATRYGEQIVPLGDAGNGGVQQSGAARPQPVPMAPLREYKAQSGDSLSKLAARFMGSSSKANRDAIVRVNPSLHQNPDKIVEGRTYVIPPAPAPAPEATAAAQSAPPASESATPATVRNGGNSPAPSANASENFSWYTVKENENLWKIAAEQLGSGNAWTQIRDLNQDILKGEDQVRSNTRIRLPNRPVASAAH